MYKKGGSSSDSMFETFDSGGGPTVPEECKGDFAHMDDGGSYPGEGDLGEHGAVPEVPSKKK